MDKLTVQNLRELFSRLKSMAIENKDYLIELDGVMGDSDLGLTMVAVFTAADKVAAEYSEADIGGLFMKAGMAMANAAPSTMGTLMATGFMRGGKALKGVEEMELSHLSSFWAAFVNGLMERGKAKPGEKTIIDALHPASVALEKSLLSEATLKQAIQEAKTAAHIGMELTRTMVAQHGRAAYYQEKSRTVQDPGAVLGSLVVNTFSDYISTHS
jgi:dihydroxyacetone kinase-like protein